jgi:hypothetical protein
MLPEFLILTEANNIHSSGTSQNGAIFMAILWPWFMPLLFFIKNIPKSGGAA